MDYVSVAEARELAGLRLVLTAGQPGPWGEAAKALFRIKGVPFTPVHQEAGGENAELQAWTGLRNAPIAVYGDEPPRRHWLEIIDLAERLGPEPPLLPEDISERVLVVGLLRELVGEKGLAWYRRIQLMAPRASQLDAESIQGSLMAQYGYSEAEAARAPERCNAVLAVLGEQLRRQREAGRQYLVGERLSALDIYWAAFSNMVKPLPPEDAPMPESTRAGYEAWNEDMLSLLNPQLIELRDHVWRDIIGLPMDF